MIRNLKLFMVSAFVLSSIAFAGNEGPEATPTPPSMQPVNIIAEVTSQGGLLPCGAPQKIALQVSDDGHVTKVVDNKRELVLTLAPKIVANLQAEIAKISGGELIDLDKDQPECLDAPRVSYRVYTPYDMPTGAIMKEIAAWQNCHRFALFDGQGERVVRFLEALTELDSFNNGNYSARCARP